MLFVFCKSF